MKEAAKRAARTFVQTFLGVYLAGLIGEAGDTLAGVADLAVLEKALAAGIVAVVTFVHNMLETAEPKIDTR